MPDVQQTSNQSGEAEKANKYSLKAAIAFYKAMPIGLRRIAKFTIAACGILVAVTFLHPDLPKAVFLTGSLLNLFIVVVVIIQAYIYLGQLEAMGEQLRLERAKTDPRLRVSKVRIENFEVGESPIFITTIANDGLIDATGVELHIGINLGDGREFKWIDPQTVMIPARGEESYPVISGASINRQDMEGFNTNVPIEVKVRVKYSPGSPTEPTEFCYRYFPWPTRRRPNDVRQFFPCDFNPRMNTTLRIQSAEIKITGHPPTVVIGPADNERQDKDSANADPQPDV